MQQLIWLPLILILCITGCDTGDKLLVDIDGNTYRTKNYNGKVWMVENLKVKRDRKGEKETYYYPNNDQKNITDYGLLYDYQVACKVCPDGWRLPTNEEWESLFQLSEATVAGDYKDSLFWANEHNSNKHGFSIRPAGYGNNGAFDNYFGTKAYFWSETKENEHDVWVFAIEKDTIRKAPQHPTYGFSVRCLKDDID